MSKDNGGPAFPGEKDIRFGQTNDCNEGMALRDYFAAKAMEAIIIGNGADISSLSLGAAKDAYAMADAMLEARNV